MGNTMRLKSGTMVHDVFVNTLKGPGIIQGTLTTPVTLPLVTALPPVPPVTPGTQDFDVSTDGTLSLDAGSYGVLKARKRAVVTLTGGVYHFQSWNIRANAQVLAAAPVDIRVADHLETRDHVTVGPAPSAPTLTAADVVIIGTGINGTTGAINATPEAVRIGTDSTIRANIYAPNGLLRIRENGSATGAFVGKWVRMGNGGTITLEGGFGLGSGGGANTPPVAEAGPEQTVSLNATVQLDGSGSTDADGNPLSFSWGFITKPLDSVAVLSDPTNEAPTFVADKPGVFSVGLVVNDGFVDSALDITLIRVGDTIPPVVTPPTNLTIEATEAGGIPISHPAIQAFLSAATAVDEIDGTVPVSSIPVSFFSLGQTSVSFVAQDTTGNEGFAIATVTVTGTVTQNPLTLTITSPEDLSLVLSSSISVSGIIDDPTSTVVVNGVVATVTDDVFIAQDVPVNEGLNTLIATATNTIGTSNQGQIRVHRVISPTLTITSPSNQSVTNQTTVTVSGTVDPPGTTVLVNGVPATMSGSTFTAGNIPVGAGTTALTAEGTTPAGSVGTATIQVVHDTTPPQVSILTPPNGMITTSATIPVAGIIHDLTIGTVNGTQAQVVVNGLPTLVNNREFLANAIPLTIGDNTLTALGTDQAGNTAMATVLVHREVSTGRQHLLVTAGNGQTGQILSALAQPLVVQVNDETGVPLVGHEVIFRITRNNGQLSDGGAQAPQLLVTTDGQGLAQVTWTLGARAGAGTNQVEVSAVGIQDKVLLTASGIEGPPTNLYKEGGDHQRGATLHALPKPLVVVVTDSEGNRVDNVPVTFSRVRGDAHFNGQPSTVVLTNGDGRALAQPALGLRAGIENYAIEATIPANVGSPLTFVASGLILGDPAQTTMSGVVLDNSDEPIAGVTVRVDGTALETQTDAQGQFALASVPVGLVGLEVDGTTAQRPGTWASLHFELVTVAGQNNNVGMPIYLLPLDLPNGLAVSPTLGGTLTLANLPGFAMTVVPGSATFPNGSQTGTISVTVVHADKVPMTPNIANQPRLVLTIQPSGVHLDPPAPISVPNTEGLPPGSIHDFYSFDHDQGRFVAVGTVTVSTDGLVVQSDPGMGIVKGGWHLPSPPPPKKGKAVTFTVSLDEIDSVLLEKVGDSPLQEKTFIVIAKGAPTTKNTDYTFEVVDDNGGSVKAEFIEQVEPCKAQPTCQARFRALSPGKPKIKVNFATEDAEKEVVIGAEVDITVAAFIPFTFVPDVLGILAEGEPRKVRFAGDVRTGPDAGSGQFRAKGIIRVRTETESEPIIVPGSEFKSVNPTVAHEIDQDGGFTGRTFSDDAVPVITHAARSVGENKIQVDLRGSLNIPFPVIDPFFGFMLPAPFVDWCYKLDIEIEDDGTARYAFDGVHGNDDFPSYEVFLNDDNVHFDPPKSGPISLYGPCTDKPTTGSGTFTLD